MYRQTLNITDKVLNSEVKVLINSNNICINSILFITRINTLTKQDPTATLAALCIDIASKLMYNRFHVNIANHLRVLCI